MKFAKRVFLIAGVYGLVVLLPQYFLEAKTGRDFPPPITHPEYYYGFIGVALVFQLVFLIIAGDPVRYRAMMLPAVLEKASFGAGGHRALPHGQNPRLHARLRPPGPAPRRALRGSVCEDC